MEILTAERSEVQQRRIAGSLATLGLVPGDRLAIALASTADVVSVALAALRCGVIPVMLDAHQTPIERQEVIADAQPALVLDDQPGLRQLLKGDRWAGLAGLPLGRPMHYTSGTTGRRKGVWSGVLADRDAHALVEEERAMWGFRPTDVHLVLSPLHHSAPLRFAASTLLAGGAIAVVDSFTGHRALAALREVRPSTLFCAPAHLQRIYRAVDDGDAMPELDQVRLLAHAGAPCPSSVKERMMTSFPEGAVWEFYGSTEGQFTACSSVDWRERPGSVGRARPGRSLSADADGTLWCRAPAHARFSYWRDDAKTATAWRGEWFSVGDLGRFDDDGYLYLEGRRDDLLLSGGVNVYPLEVELALSDLAGVEDIVVFGRTDEHWGQRVCAAYVGKVTEQQLRDWAEVRLSSAKRPKEYHRLDSLPHSAAGKLRRVHMAASLGLSP